jgi:hypothetical protein
MDMHHLNYTVLNLQHFSCRRSLKEHIANARSAPSWTWLLRILTIALLERLSPKLAARLELLTLAVPVTDALGLLAVSPWL